LTQKVIAAILVSLEDIMRTDEHRPSAIIPEDYEFVSFDYFGGSDLGAIMALLSQREIFRAHMARTGGTYAVHQNSGSCHICGANALYICRWYHAKSNTYIETGEDCARKLDMSYGDMNAFRRVVADAREAQAGKKKAIALLADAGLARVWDLYIAQYPQHAAECPAAGRDQYGDDNGATHACACDVEARRREWDHYEERTIRDIVGKLVKYGSISPAQIGFITKLLGKIEQRPIIEAQRAAEREAAAPVPTGRVRITGVVVGRKVVEDQYDRFSGERTCIIVKDTTGFKVYGSQFALAQVGDAVDFTATLTPSKDDPKFGFFKRPKVYTEPQPPRKQSKEEKAARKAARLASHVRQHLRDSYECYEILSGIENQLDAEVKAFVEQPAV
jgi:hypothetical protein